MHCYEVAASKIKEEIMYESLCYVLPLICKPCDALTFRGKLKRRELEERKLDLVIL